MSRRGWKGPPGGGDLQEGALQKWGEKPAGGSRATLAGHSGQGGEGGTGEMRGFGENPVERG